MATLTSIRNTIEKKIFTALGSNITINYLTSSVDIYGDEVVSSTVVSSEVGVPYDYITSNKLFQTNGIHEEGEFRVLLRYNVPISQADQIVYDGNTYDVFEVEKFSYSNGNLASLARCHKQVE